MNYFRRPKLAGLNLPRLNLPTIRGNVRRHEADGSVAAPYFSGVTATQTLIVQSQTNSATVALTGNTMAQVLSDLNTGLASINVTAFDADGCLGLKTTAGGTNFVKVTGGTAAAALGFDITAQRFISYGGDIESPSEGRKGTTFGTSFPNRGESLSVDSFTKALGRVSGNADILHSDIVRQEVVVKKVTTYTAPSDSAPTYYDLAAGLRIYAAGQPSGTPILDGSSTTAELARFFFLVDGDTGVLSHVKVSGVTDASNVNILGAEQSLVTNAAITAIVDGSTIKVDGEDFVSLGVEAGDFVKITSATNTTPTSNNGYRWAVEEVLAAHQLVVRPLSASELALVGETADVAGRQPVLELNATGASGFGNVTVTRGPWAKGARLQFTPALPHGMKVDVWVAVPASTHDRAVHDLVPAYAATSAFVPAKSAFDAPLSVPSVTAGASTITVGTFYVRWNGRAVRMASATVSRTGGVTNYVYWNVSTCVVESSTSLSLTNRRLLALVASNDTVTTCFRLDGGVERDVTVGADGQFTSLASAVAWARQQYAAGAAGYHRIVMTDSSTSISSGLTLDFPVTVAGRHGGCVLARSGGSYAAFTTDGTYPVMLRDFRYDANGSLITGTLTKTDIVNVSDSAGTTGTALAHGTQLNISYLPASTSINDGTALNVGTATPTVALGKSDGATTIGGSTATVSLHGSTVGLGDASSAVSIGGASATITIGGASATTHIHGNAQFDQTLVLDGTIDQGLSKTSVTGSLVIETSNANDIIFKSQGTEVLRVGNYGVQTRIALTAAEGTSIALATGITRGGAKLDLDGNYRGQLTLYDVNAQNPAILTRPRLTTLTGGASSDADLLHTHGAIAAHLSDPVAAHAASAISVIPQRGVVASDAQLAFEEQGQKYITRYSAGLTLTGSYQDLPNITVAAGTFVKSAAYLIELEFAGTSSDGSGNVQVKFVPLASPWTGTYYYTQKITTENNSFAVTSGAGAPSEPSFTVVTAYAPGILCKIVFPVTMPAPAGDISALVIQARHQGGTGTSSISAVTLRCTRMSW